MTALLVPYVHSAHRAIALSFDFAQPSHDLVISTFHLALPLLGIYRYPRHRTLGRKRPVGNTDTRA
jgi:hypothetical protein